MARHNRPLRQSFYLSQNKWSSKNIPILRNPKSDNFFANGLYSLNWKYHMFLTYVLGLIYQLKIFRNQLSSWLISVCKSYFFCHKKKKLIKVVETFHSRKNHFFLAFFSVASPGGLRKLSILRVAVAFESDKARAHMLVWARANTLMVLLSALAIGVQWQPNALKLLFLLLTPCDFRYGRLYKLCKPLGVFIESSTAEAV